MAYAKTMRWFHQEFGSKVYSATQGTIVPPELVMAIAAKETGGYVRRMLEDGRSRDEILLRCVGDSIERSDDIIPRSERNDASGNQLWPIVREALELISQYSSSYRSVKDRRPDAYCRGFGIFQYDLDYYHDDPAFFLQRRWQDFDECLSRFMDELRSAQHKNRWDDRTSLSFDDQVGLAIAYNNGRYKPEKMFRQGHRNSDSGRYYGEEMVDVLREALSLGLEWGGRLAAPPRTRAGLVKVARDEWNSWGRSTWDLKTGSKRIARRDTDEETANYIIDRFLTPIGAKATLAQIMGDDYAWSAVGMSYFFRKAAFTADEFPFAQSHSKWIRYFIAAAKENREALFHGHRLNDASPEPGDLVCYLREGLTFDASQAFFDVTHRYQSHTDLVVARRDREIDVIGANVAKSVTMKTVPLNADGHISDRNFPWFAVLKSRFA